MSIINENIIDIELTGSTVFRSFQNKSIGEGDSYGERFGMRVFKDGTLQSLSGSSCLGFFIRPDGITLVVEGFTSGSTAYVELPPAAYAKTGQFTLAVKLYGGTVANTTCMFDGTVVDTTTGEIADTASVITSVSDFEELLEDAEAAAEVIDSISIEASQITGTRYKISVTKE